MVCWRNKLAWRLCNMILWVIATKAYRETLDKIIRSGMKFLDGEKS